MVNKILYFIKKIFWIFFGKEPIFINKHVKSIPDKLKPNIFYIEGNGNKNQFASLLCPCGCREEINLNLEPDEDPCWTLNPGHITDLSPSIWKSGTCRSHFFIKKGRIKWCKTI